MDGTIHTNSIESFWATIKRAYIGVFHYWSSKHLHRYINEFAKKASVGNDFIYADPPYYLGEDSKMFVGMYPHRNFPIQHKGFNHKLLRDLLLSHKGGFILSYNDCETIRKWYSDCNIIAPKWQYTFGQGDVRIGKNRNSVNNSSHIKKSHELLIWKISE